MGNRLRIVTLPDELLNRTGDPFVPIVGYSQLLKPEIADIVGVPHDAVCIRSRHVWRNNNVEVLMQHDSFAHIPEGSEYPRKAA